ncbi:MAG: class I SAM-dependent methyltransferase [bacterium]
MSEDKSWFESDEFWEVSEPVLFPPERIEAAPDEVAQILNLTTTTPKSAVLDLCCGVGRHSVALAGAGMNVTAVDLTDRHLARTEAAARDKGLAIEIVKSDMRQFCRPEAYDLIVNLFTSFGYFEREEDDRLVATNMFRSLRSGGKAVIDIISKERLAKIFLPNNWSELDDGTLLLEERRATQDWGWMENRWIFIKGTQRHDLRFGHRLYSAVELKKLMLAAGFSSVQAFGSLEGAPFDHESKRLIIVACK